MVAPQTHSTSGRTTRRRKPQKHANGKANGAAHTAKAGAKRRTRNKKKSKTALTAKNADRHVLYQMSVQDADVEVSFIDRVFKKHRGRKALSLREDFCGTALVACHWVKESPKRTSIGVDIDPGVLTWGREHNLLPLEDDAARVTLLEQDVRAGVREKVDAIIAFNFSYWIFTDREGMRDYFRTVRKGLKNDGVFMLDAYGGWEAVEPMFDERSIKGKFTYVWDQDEFDPITHRVVNYIHFRFKDGSKMERAFTYEWRFWTLPELRELLLEAGFSDVHIWWDRADDEDDEDYRPTRRTENQPAWLAYIAALP
jgi:SAM-dependent methyltransferase